MKEYRCRVCEGEFEDLLLHLYKEKEKVRDFYEGRSGFLEVGDEDIEEKHLEMYKAIKGNLEKERCFCGGRIIGRIWVSEDGDAYIWEYVCERCGYEWDNG